MDDFGMPQDVLILEPNPMCLEAFQMLITISFPKKAACSMDSCPVILGDGVFSYQMRS